MRIALNRTAETGAWNVETLRLEFEELTLLGEDVLLTGFEMVEIDGVMLEDDEAPDEWESDAPPAPPIEVISLTGDVWVLRDHRLIQGDARHPGVYERLLGDGEIASLVL